MSAFKKTFGKLLANTTALFLLFLAGSTTRMALAFFRKTWAKYGVTLTGPQTWELLRANVHWILTFTTMASLCRALALSFSFHPADDRMVLRRRVRRWLAISCLAAPLHLLHSAFVLPAMNHEAAWLRKTLLQGEWVTREEVPKSYREMTFVEMRTSIRKAEAGTVTAGQRRWIRNLQWEASKKIQLALCLPLLAIIAISAGVSLRRIRRGALRFVIVYLGSAAVLVGLFNGLAWTSRRMENGDLPLSAGWILFSGVAASAAVCGHLLYRRLSGEDPDRSLPGDEGVSLQVEPQG